MHKKTCLTAGIMLAILGMPGFASAETLEEALVFAYNTNPTLLAQRARVRLNDELVPQALANWRPTVKLSADAGLARNVSNAVVPQQQTDKPKDWTLSAVQPLYRGGQTVAQTKQAEATVHSERALLAATEQSVLFNVVTAYTNVVEDQSVVELNKNNEQVLQRQLDATNDRFRVGEVTRTDVAQAESRLSAAHGDTVSAQGNLDAAVANYVTMVGHAPDALVPPAPLSTLPLGLDEARDQAVAQNPNVLAQQYIYDAAAYGVDLANGALLPLITLTLAYTKSLDSDFYYLNGFNGATNGSGTQATTGTLNLTVPIYQQGAEYSRIRQAKHSAGQQLTLLDQTRRDNVEAAARAWEGLVTAKARIISYSDQIKAADIALEGVRRESQVGSRTVLDVLNAEQELLSAKVNLVQAQHDETLGEFQLKGSVGELTAQALALPVEIYDPVKHYEEVRDQWFGTSVTPAYGEEIK